MNKWLNLLKEHQKNPKTPSYPTDKTDESTPEPTFGSFGSTQDGRFQEKNTQQPPQAKVIHPGLEQWQALYGQPAQKPEPAPPSAPETSAPALDGQQQPVLSVLAELHSRPEWVAARDAWFDHLFQCDECRRNRQQIRRPYTPNPCAEGRHLCEIYENIR